MHDSEDLPSLHLAFLTRIFKNVLKRNGLGSIVYKNSWHCNESKYKHLWEAKLLNSAQRSGSVHVGNTGTCLVHLLPNYMSSYQDDALD